MHDRTGTHPAGNPSPLPEDPRDLLHLVAIRAWQALAGGRPAPGLDPADLQQAIYQAFATGDGWHPVDRLCEGWLDLAPQCGLAVDDVRANLPRPDVLDAIGHTVAAAIWFDLIVGYLTLTGRCAIPRKFLSC
jgi:hypothetical protein